MNKPKQNKHIDTYGEQSSGDQRKSVRTRCKGGQLYGDKRKLNFW